MYCTNCGSKIDEKAVICPNCVISTSLNSNYNNIANIGFGIVLCLIWREEKPSTSKALAIGFITNLLIIIALYTFYFSIIVFATGSIF